MSQASSPDDTQELSDIPDIEEEPLLKDMTTLLLEALAACLVPIVDKDLSVCTGCIEEQPNQLAHSCMNEFRVPDAIDESVSELRFDVTEHQVLDKLANQLYHFANSHISAREAVEFIAKNTPLTTKTLSDHKFRELLIDKLKIHYL